MNKKKSPLHSSEVVEDIGQDLILTNIRDKLLFSIKLLLLGQDTTSLKSVFKFTENEIDLVTVFDAILMSRQNAWEITVFVWESNVE